MEIRLQVVSIIIHRVIPMVGRSKVCVQRNCAYYTCIPICIQLWLYVRKLVAFIGWCLKVYLVYIRIFLRCNGIVVILYLYCWVISYGIGVYFLVDRFREYRRHQVCACKRMLDEFHILTSNDTIVYWIRKRIVWVVVNGVIPILVASPYNLRIAVRHIILTTISSNTCYYLVVSWGA